ncbi:TIGR03084 family metal-binding protein [Geodermatophilus maliterrae]|uniref:TIGR03084 family metal-binding protein n=1 Tax=Geodermatophilus maliterrae TaxID=3162531 RepID=A0ABV3XM93_9ACTN
MDELQQAVSALAVDAAEVDRLVAGLSPEEWSTPTPAPGWSIAHQIGHLAFVCRIAGVAAAQPEAFTALVSRIGSGPGAFDAAVNGALGEYVALDPAALLERWRAERDAAVAALAAAPADGLVPWLVNPLPPAVLARAGMLEVFAHGQDVADALGVQRTHTDRLRHVVAFAVRTRDFGYLSRGLTPPAEEFRFELVGPSGATWEFGPADAAQRVTGDAVDLCLLVSRRRHRADLQLTAVGELAEQWLELAQAYRGPAGPGRAPGQFVDGASVPGEARPARV